MDKMLDLDVSLSYEGCRETIVNWSDGDLEDYLTNYRGHLSSFREFFASLGSTPVTEDAVSDELLERRTSYK